MRPTAPPPLSWLQFVRAEFAIQEPILQQYGLDTPVNDILAAIQAHIAHWQDAHPEALAAQAPETGDQTPEQAAGDGEGGNQRA